LKTLLVLALSLSFFAPPASAAGGYHIIKKISIPGQGSWDYLTVDEAARRLYVSHGTQDLYPDFLKDVHKLGQTTVADIAILYNIGAILGAAIFGHLSERIGRRRSILAALTLALLMIPAWSFGGTVGVLAVGAFALQMGVQGAWGIIPAHLNELAPDSVRGLVPGLAYQMGILIAAPTSNIEHALKDTLGYRGALASFEIAVIVALALATMLGSEKKGKVFVTLPAE